MFIPSEERITAIQETISSKFDFIETIKISINSIENMLNNLEGAPKLTLHLGSTRWTEEGDYTILDLSWYAPYKTYGDLILTGFIYIGFIWRLFITLPSTISGLAGDVKAVSIKEEK